MTKTKKDTRPKTASVSEVKASLSSYLARVKAGEVVVVTERGTPIAKLVPLVGDEDSDAERLMRLAAEGVVLPGSRAIQAGFWELERPPDPDGEVLKGLLEERDAGW